MKRTFFQDFDRDDDTQVTVEYTFTGGCPAHMGSMNYPGHPAEPAEVEIIKAWETTSEKDVVLTEAEDTRFCQYLIENHEDSDDREWESE